MRAGAPRCTEALLRVRVHRCRAESSFICPPLRGAELKRKEAELAEREAELEARLSEIESDHAAVEQAKKVRSDGF